MSDNLILAIFLTMLLISLGVSEFCNRDEDEYGFIVFLFHVCVVLALAIIMLVKMVYKG